MPGPTKLPLSPTLSAVQRAVLGTRSFRASPWKGYTAALAIVAFSFGVRLLFGDALPPLCVLKPWLGHTLGACGLSETLLLVENLTRLPGVDYAAEALLPLSAQPTSIAADSLLLANFFGFGGNNASLILQRCTGAQA